MEAPIQDVVKRLSSLSQYCERLSKDLLDRRMRETLSEASGYFAEQAEAFRRRWNDMQKVTGGRYRTPASGNRPAMAYVIDGRHASYISEEQYRAKKYKPAFEELPTEDEYDG